MVYKTIQVLIVAFLISKAMTGQNRGEESVSDLLSVEERLSRAQSLVPEALEKAKEVKGFPAKWKAIIKKLEQIPSRLSDVSSHPFFSKSTLCNEHLEAVSSTLEEAINLAESCARDKFGGKLRMQNDLDSLAGKLDVNLHDCGLLIKTGLLSEVSSVSSKQEWIELLARLQIGDLEAKHKALDSLVEAMKNDEKGVLSAMRQSDFAALVHLLTATSPRIREKTVTIISSLVEYRTCSDLLLSVGVLPPLLRLVEYGSTVGREKSTISLQRLSISAETSRFIAGNAGIRPLIDICLTGDSGIQSAAVCTLNNISAVPETRQALVEEGIVKTMINVLDNGIFLESKEHAAECLRNLTSCGENFNFRTYVISEGGVKSLLSYLKSPIPQESAVSALRNLVSSISEDVLVSLDIVSTLARVLESGSVVAQEAAAEAICRICSSTEGKRLVGEAGCVPLLVNMLEAKSNGVREVAAQAISSLMSVSRNLGEVRKVDKSVPNLVALLDPSFHNTAKKYAVACLALLVSSKRLRKLMVAHGAIGYLKKLVETEVPGAKRLLLGLMGSGGLKRLFIRK